MTIARQQKFEGLIPQTSFLLTGYDELDDIETSWFLYFLIFLFFMIPISEQYRINIKNAIELIDNTLELVKDSKKKWNEYDRSSDFLQTGNGFLDFNIKTLEDIRKEIAKKPYQKLP